MTRRSEPLARHVRGSQCAHSRLGRAPVTGLLLMALALNLGCGREFYRNWANQDASEATFEKSRDPRWRLDMFSIEPPALARYADPYHPDRPPAPPDDFAAQSLSPVPQWPVHRMLVPVEGTGYLDMLDAWQRQRADQAPAAATQPANVPGYPVAPTAAPPAAPSPFAPGGNSRPNAGGMSPITIPGSTPAGPPSPTAPSAPINPDAGTSSAGRPQAKAKQVDSGVRLAAHQEPGLPQPPPPTAPTPTDTQNQPSRDLLRTPPIGQDPNPRVDQDLSQPINPRPDLTPDQYRESEARGAEIAGMFIPEMIELNEAEAAGLPRTAKPYVLTIEQSFTLALINSRVYQTQLENIYLASLAVTLQRFAFEPQFFAGLSPLTGVAQGGFPIANPINQFIYRTKEAPGGQTSLLNMGTVAGTGKFFNTGARLLLGFANQVVFNFVGKTPRQPVVQSSLPLSLVQPFLRGGGRAVALEALTQVERNLLYQIRAFAKFRQEFVVATLVGGQIQNLGSFAPSLGFSGGGNIDPTTGFINVLQDLQQVENDRRNVAAFEKIATVYQELIKGEASGLSQLQLDQVDSRLQSARQSLIGDRTTYRLDLDSFKLQMGLPPDVPLVLDRGLTKPFKDVFDEVDQWQTNPKREMTDLEKFAARLPLLEDVIIDGRSVLGVYKEGKNDEDELEDLLLAAERVALENRLDMMNNRAQLYDAWRQIKVTANALKGVLNVAITNQIFTPPTTTNPFAFVDQAKQFSLVLNAELPLVRLNERNQFRAALIGYQRARRALQNQEDALKLFLRRDVRDLHQQYLSYELAKRNFVLNIRIKDQAFEQIIQPPAGAGGVGQTAQAATQTNNLIQSQGQLIGLENQLVLNWQNYQLARLQLYRDLGTLPYDEWEAFGELFPNRSSNTGASSAFDGSGATGTATPNPAQGVGP